MTQWEFQSEMFKLRVSTWECQDKNVKIIIEPSVYQNWFTDPSDNCTIEEYQMVVPKNPRDEAEGNIDIYDPKDFTDPGIYTDIVYLEDEIIIIDKEADMLYIPV